MRTLENSPVLILGVDAIGAGIARRFAREGARLALLHDDPEAAEPVATSIVAAGGEAVIRRLSWHSGVTESVGAAIRDLGGLQVLVTNVLPSPGVASLEAQTAETFDQAFGRVRAAVCAMQEAFPWLRDSGRGRIINVGHRYGEAVNAGIAAYNAAAYSLVGITRSAALDWGRHQIVSNLLLPVADTPEYRACHAQRPQVLDLMVSQLALRRLGDPEDDIGAAALFLAGDCASYVNGETVHADGGQHVAGPVLDIGRFPQVVGSTGD